MNDPFVKGGVQLPKNLLNVNSGSVEFGTAERGDMAEMFGQRRSMVEEMGVFTVDEDSASEAPHLM